MRSRIVSPLVVATILIAFVTAIPGCAGEANKLDVILATTTSTQDSGLLDVLVPAFEKKTGYKVKTIAVGSGAALTMGERGEADVLLVHSPAAENKIVDAGVGVNYQLVMHNDYIVVGPSSDPAKIRGEKKATQAFARIASVKSVFVSRGDESGTHTKEKEIWGASGVRPEAPWYMLSGTGMAQTLTIASEKAGYTLTDRATYLTQKKNLKLDLLVEGDAPLLNIYHVMQVSPQKFPKVNSAGAKAFVDFIMSADTQRIIGSFGVDKYGQSLFFPDAGKKMEDLTGTK
jgi:tungstate transport system substrate-binding protein